MIKKIILFTLFLFPIYSFSSTEIIPNEYKAYYDGFYKGDKVGTLEKEFKKNKNNYVIKSKSNVKGKYGFLTVRDKRTEVSEFFIDDNIKFHPIHYRMERTGTWVDFIMDIRFNYSTKKINLEYKKRKEEKDINSNILDNALYLLRLQHEIKNNNRDSIQYDIAYKTGFRDFHFKYKKEETIKVKGKNTKTLLYEQIKNRDENDKSGVFAWFDPSRDYVLVKLLYLDKKGKEEIRFKLSDYSPK